MPTAFTVVHARPLGAAQAAALCPAMDLLALAGGEAGLSVLRWMEWQRAFALGGGAAEEGALDFACSGLRWCADGSLGGVHDTGWQAGTAALPTLP